MNQGLFRVVKTLALGLAGGLVFSWLNLPLPWLLGALVFNLAASFTGLDLGLGVGFRYPALVILGVTIGSTLTPELISRVHEWWLTLSAMVLFVAIVTPLAILYCRRIMGFDRVSAFFSGMPGGLSEMIVGGVSAGGDPQKISLAHASRVTVILLLLAPALHLLAGIELPSGRVSSTQVALSPADALILLTCGVSGVLLGRLLRLPNPWLLGPLIMSALAHLFSLTAARPPGLLLDVVQLIIGCYVGAQFAGSSLKFLIRILGLSTILTVCLLVLTVLFSASLSKLTGFEFIPVLLAFIPGGIAEISLVALLLNIDPIFIAAHHVFRLLLILGTVPFLKSRARQLSGPPDGD